MAKYWNDWRVNLHWGIHASPVHVPLGQLCLTVSLAQLLQMHNPYHLLSKPLVCYLQAAFLMPAALNWLVRALARCMPGEEHSTYAESSGQLVQWSDQGAKPPHRARYSQGAREEIPRYIVSMSITRINSHSTVINERSPKDWKNSPISFKEGKCLKKFHNFPCARFPFLPSKHQCGVYYEYSPH